MGNEKWAALKTTGRFETREALEARAWELKDRLGINAVARNCGVHRNCIRRIWDAGRQS